MSTVLSNFLFLLVTALWVLILLRVVLSWMSPTGGGGFTAFIYQATEPFLSPIRRLLPPMGGLDWSPFVALVLLSLIESFFR